MAKITKPDFSKRKYIDYAEQRAILGRVSYVLGKRVPGTILKSVPRGFLDVPRTGPLPKFTKGIEKYFTDLLKPTLKVVTSFDDAELEFEHHFQFTGPLQNLALKLATSIFVSANGDTHPLWYWLDRGIPATTFPKGSTAFPLVAEPKTTGNSFDIKHFGLPKFVKASYKGGVVTFGGTTSNPDEAEKFAYQPGDTRPAQDPRNWSGLALDAFRKDFRNVVRRASALSGVGTLLDEFIILSLSVKGGRP